MHAGWMIVARSVQATIFDKKRIILLLVHSLVLVVAGFLFFQIIGNVSTKSIGYYNGTKTISKKRSYRVSQTFTEEYQSNRLYVCTSFSVWGFCTIQQPNEEGVSWVDHQKSSTRLPRNMILRPHMMMHINCFHLFSQLTTLIPCSLRNFFVRT